MSSPDSTPHLSLDALADLLAGEGTDDDLAHVGGCAGCAGRLDELATADAAVSATLSALPAPTMPAELAERLSAALAAEPALQATPASAGPVALDDDGAGPATGAPNRSTGSATVTPFPDAGRRRRAWLPAAAAVALLVCGGALGTSLLLSDGAGSDDADTSAASGGDGSDEAGALSDFSRSETGTDYAATGALDAALPRLLAGPTTEQSAPLSAGQPAQDSADQPETAAAPAPEPSRLLSTQAQPESAARADPALDRLRTPEGLASCLTAVLPPEDPAVRPLAVDYAVYQAQPALVVVLPAAGTPDKVDVFVVGADCAVGNDATLFFTRLDRPS